jgi:hypothetical protein
MKLKAWSLALFGAAAVLAFTAAAGAVDGTIEINQAKVLANGGSFPYVISNPGSYRLTGNLTVSSTSADAIDVNASQVTIDLNGFSISGPGSSSVGHGIAEPSSSELEVENGTITGFLFGLLIGNNSIVKSVRADSNGSGIQTGANSVVQGCTANGNSNAGTANGIRGGVGTVISGNTANGNSGNGIICGNGCLISGNTIGNNILGIFAPNATSGYGGNVLNGNSASTVGGTSLGNNLCNGVVC